MCFVCSALNVLCEWSVWCVKCAVGVKCATCIECVESMCWGHHFECVDHTVRITLSGMKTFSAASKSVKHTKQYRTICYCKQCSMLPLKHFQCFSQFHT